MRFVLGLCRQGWARATWRCLVAATPFVLFAVSAALVLAGHPGLPGLPRETLGHVMRLEGYVFATGFFFMWSLLFGLAGVNRAPPAVVLSCILVVIVAFLTWILWSTRPGIAVVLQYWALIIASYSGALLDRDGPAAFLAWMQRTAWMIICYAVVLMSIDAPVNVDSWSTQDSVMRVVLAYFSLLAFMELTGFYHSDWLRRGAASGAGAGGAGSAADPAASPNPARERFAARLRSFGERKKGRNA